MVNIEWLTAPFLWDGSLKDKDNRRIKQPAILRFDSDSFMEEIAEKLENDPSQLKDYVARYETWTNKVAGWLPEGEHSAGILKLYQPMHGFFYLLVADLVCRVPGFPDRKVDTSKKENVSFVIRRLAPSNNITFDPKNPATFIEYAFSGGNWRKASLDSVSYDEERLPLFSINYKQDGKRRRLLAGLIPVSAREKYQTEPKFSILDMQEDSLKDPRIIQFNTRIVETINKLKEAIHKEKYSSNTNEIEANENEAREVFLYIISDLAEFLQKYLDVVWNAILQGSWNEPITKREDEKKKEVFDQLDATYFSFGKKWINVLKEYSSDKSVIVQLLKKLKLNDIETTIGKLEIEKLNEDISLALDPLPDPRLAKFETYIADKLVEIMQTIPEKSDDQARKLFLFIVLDFAQFLNEHLPEVWEALKNESWRGANNSRKELFNRIESTNFYASYHWGDVLREVWDNKINAISVEVKGPIAAGLVKNRIAEAINSLGIKDAGYRQSNFYTLISKAVMESSPAMKIQEMANIDSSAGALYFLRCVYDRPKCKNISLPTISEPSQVFQLAPFYDPDAPGRPLKVTMPIDTSIAGLRKYPKNVSFLLSNKLRAQMERIKDVDFENLDKGNVKSEPSFDLGMVCSFSIPIITICALLLLMIIVQLLNIIFWWMAFFRICLPLPKLRK